MSDILDEPVRKIRKTDYAKKRYRPILVIGPILLFAFIFQSMHWPGNALLMIVGLAALSGHALAIAFHLHKNDVLTNIGTIILPFAIAYRISVQYNMNGVMLAIIVAIVSLLLCLLYFRERKA